ncbi:antigen 5 like allergen Cul n 1-like [Zeugodacus cucurbitae]|uniref:antigen 5 like allergen Cul n 1-like n=1 Tax=Zeugodacus cucurbitae TaxID=28588 RepID=UPI0023D90F37|nr:antigen 5 like allergen Cul n 1-like [Zeugodacus cucurbitae]
MLNIHYFRFYLVAVLMWPYIFTNAYYYCDKQDKLCGDKKHFMCDPDAVPSEEEFLGLLPLTGSIKRLYLDRHNEYRNKLAGGDQEFEGGGKFPKATRMREMIWDDELAYLAGIHAKRCHLKRADCHATARFPSSGQNHFVKYFYEKPKKVIDKLLQSLDSWWQESQYIEDGNAMVDEFPIGVNLTAAAQFSTIAYEHAAFVGCGLSICQNRSEKPYCVHVTCYYSATNVNGTFTYKKGNSSASECDHYESVPSHKYANLCKNSGKIFIN